MLTPRALRSGRRARDFGNVSLTRDTSATPVRRVVFGVLVVLLVAGAWDLTRAPDRQRTSRAVIVAVHVYQATLSRVFAVSGVTCRFDPTCSHYSEAVLSRHGLVRGGWLAATRVLRCGPWTPMGTLDPPPTGA